MRKARFAQIGARPAAFATVRYSEKLLERTGISVESIDLSEIFGRAWGLNDKESSVLSKLDEIRDYVKTTRIPRESLVRMAKFAVVLDQYIAERELSGTAIQCWTSMEENFGVVPCTVMSMLSNALSPSACETDISGLLGMYAMIQASGRPSGMADWNNNYSDDPDKCVLFHCSNFPQEFFANKGVMDYQEILAGTVGREKTYGTVVGRLAPTDFTYCRVSTDDFAGQNPRVRRGGGDHHGPHQHVRRLRGGADPSTAGAAAPHLLTGVRASRCHQSFPYRPCHRRGIFPVPCVGCVQP